MPRIAVGAVELNYEEKGSGSAPPVLLHALGGNAAFVQPRLDALGRRWRTIAIDLRGHAAGPVRELGEGALHGGRPEAHMRNR